MFIPKYWIKHLVSVRFHIKILWKFWFISKSALERPFDKIFFRHTKNLGCILSIDSCPALLHPKLLPQYYYGTGPFLLFPYQVLRDSCTGVYIRDKVPGSLEIELLTVQIDKCFFIGLALTFTGRQHNVTWSDMFSILKWSFGCHVHRHCVWMKAVRIFWTLFLSLDALVWGQLYPRWYIAVYIDFWLEPFCPLLRAWSMSDIVFSKLFLFIASSFLI